jgi:4-hydroxybenzoate polyprenyltransferase
MPTLPGSLSRRLLTVLQLTRMALVFTAIADSQCELLLTWTQHGEWPSARLVILLLIISVGLYGFGMSLNDIIDRRRDAQIASDRPLPSGRIRPLSAQFISIALVLAALIAGVDFARHQPRFGVVSFALLLLTGALIAFYDLAGKYLVGPGLFALGLIRFAHCLIAAPSIPIPWHSLWLMNHVVVLSTVAYVWEDKRPTLTKSHWWGVLGMLGLFDLAAISLVAWRRHRHTASLAAALNLQIGLLLPIAAVLVFIALAIWLRHTNETRRAAGKKLMLYGLLWLIVYDACFAVVYANVWAGLALLMLLPVAYLSVMMMRWWGQLVLLSQRPQFQRAVMVESPSKPSPPSPA